MRVASSKFLGVLLTIHFIFLGSIVSSQAEQEQSGSTAYWIFFKDKGFADELSRLQAIDFEKEKLSLRVRWRRSKTMGENIVRYADLQVCPHYILELEDRGLDIRHTSRWLNAVSCRLDQSSINKIENFPFVLSVQPVATFRHNPAVRTSQMERMSANMAAGKGFEEVLDYGESGDQLRQINVHSAHYLGFSGIGIIVCMLDTGFWTSHESLKGRTIIGEWDFINNDGTTSNEEGDPAGQQHHGTATFSTLGGRYDGKLIGPAFNAAFLLGKTENTAYELPVEEDNWVAGLEWAEINGADIVSSSLGYLEFEDGSGYSYYDMDGETATTSIAASMAAERGVLVVNSMGNEGPYQGTLTAPADAFDIIACGAVDSSGLLAQFSSRGPTADGRIKPELVACGVATFCAESSQEDEYTRLNGTSLSTPLLGGAAALVLEANPQWTPYQVRDALMLSANRSATPGTDYGSGLPDVVGAIYNFPFYDNPVDADGSGRIDGLDLILFSRAMDSEIGDENYCPEFDIDHDGSICIIEIKLVEIYAGKIIPDQP